MCVGVWLLKQLNTLRRKAFILNAQNSEHTGKDRLKNYNMCYRADVMQVYKKKIKIERSSCNAKLPAKSQSRRRHSGSFLCPFY